MVLAVENLSKTYQRGGEAVHALRDVSLQVEAGELVALTGPSGSGKSSLLNIIAGFDRPTAGRVCVAGLDVGGLAEKEIDRLRTRRIGFVFQQFNLVAGLTATENVELALMRSPLDRLERRKRAHDALAQLGLEKEANRRPALLSGGQQQRVAIARAMVAGPELLLADEPTAALDSVAAARLLDLIAALAKSANMAALVATHDDRCIARTDRTFKFLDGQLQ